LLSSAAKDALSLARAVGLAILMEAVAKDQVIIEKAVKYGAGVLNKRWVEWIQR
jgi:hypothetical protein